MTSEYQDSDYMPVAPKKSNRGRKRKSIDSDYGTEKEEAKKLKNAAAAARYREKQKLQSSTFEAQLAKVAEKHAELAKKFNSRLTERNFMLKLVYEAHKNNQNGLGARKFPAWVDAWFKEQQKD
jgi:CRISPR/Cas system-associated endoribonuclease Cas2